MRKESLKQASGANVSDCSSGVAPDPPDAVRPQEPTDGVRREPPDCVREIEPLEGVRPKDPLLPVPLEDVRPKDPPDCTPLKELPKSAGGASLGSGSLRSRSIFSVFSRLASRLAWAARSCSSLLRVSALLFALRLSAGVR